MAYLVELTEPGSVGIRAYADPAPGHGEAAVRTWYSGISAGTELATYRGTNPYLQRRWDPDAGTLPARRPTFGYPMDVWGYSEVGVVEASATVYRRSRSARWSGGSGGTDRMPCCRPNG